MEDRGTSCTTSRERLGLHFTIDYLLYNKGAKSSKTATEKSSTEELTILHSTLVDQSPVPKENRDRRHPEKNTKGLEDENEVEEIKEEEEEGAEEEEMVTPVSTEGPQDKPTQSYIALISMAILESEEKKLLLCDIYRWIMEHYPYFKSKDKNWRNSVRHNLSLNECFIKAGRSDNGKGHYWAIHPTNYRDFSNGDYHQRRARRRTRRVTGQLSCFPLSSPYYATLNHQRATTCCSQEGGGVASVDRGARVSPHTSA
ncbi:forkhead box Q2 [Aplochiton taeniatus]